MRRALLDTDILSELLKGKNETVRQRAAEYQAQLGELTICTVTVMEVVKGLHIVTGSVIQVGPPPVVVGSAVDTVPGAMV